MKTSPVDIRYPSTRSERWLYALKPASWPKLFVPTLFGQVLGATVAGHLSVLALAWGLAFSVMGVVFIVLVNDWGDRAVDSVKRTMFPDSSSPKTIPDQILRAPAVGWVGLVFGGLTLLMAAGAQSTLHRPMSFLFGLFCVGIFVAYTLPPIRLNYRGGGELLEMLGVGIGLPMYNAYLQAGVWWLDAWPWVAGFALLSLASAIASGLSDEQSDRAGGKRTVASMFGNLVARRATEVVALAGAGTWLAASLINPVFAPLWIVAPVVTIFAWYFVGTLRASHAAVTAAFPEQAIYKQRLHRAIWHSTIVGAVLLWVRLVT